MTAVASQITVRGDRERRTARRRAELRARQKARLEPLAIFVLVAAAMTALGIQTTAHLHLIYPESLTRLVHAYIAWWNDPPRFRAIGFSYPPLQTFALLPFALLRPLATSMVALPLFSGLCAGALVATLDRTLCVLTLAWWARWPMLAGFVLNPLFLDYSANGMATILVMALLAAGLHHFTAWYVNGVDSVRSLGFCGGWMAIAFLARYETILWLLLFMVAVAVVRFRSGASVIEVVALEAILSAPFVYVFLIWSGVSSLVGGGGFLSWITRPGGEILSGLTFNGRVGLDSRVAGVVEVVWRTSPLILIVPALLVIAAALARRPILVIIAATVVVGAAASVARMWINPNPSLLQPDYQMLGLVPMLVAAGWLAAQLPGHGAPRLAQTGRGLAVLVILMGLGASAVTAYDLMRDDGSSYDRDFTYALSSHLQRITPAAGSTAADGAPQLWRDTRALATFLQAASYGKKIVLVDELAFPGLVLAADTTRPYRTLAENGTAFWTHALDHPRGRAKILYLIAANPQLTVPGYPTDLVSARYRGAYAGHLPHSAVIFRDPLFAVVQLLAPG